jgi:hypothetical protein
MVQYTTPTMNSAAANESVEARRTSLLELLHPNGSSNQSFVIGSNSPAVLLPAPRAQDGKYADLVILAPTVTECRTSRWLEEAAQSLAQKLEADGVAYVLAPPPWRLRVKRLLRGNGLVIGPPIVHLPDRASSRYLVPLTPIPALYAFSKLLPLPPWGRRLAMIGLRLPGVQKLLGNVLPSVGFVAHRPGARPLFDWLFQLDQEGQRPGSAVISSSWRGQDGAVVLHRFPGWDAQPSAIAKMNLTATMAEERVAEAATLARLGPGARSAGAQVPQPLLLGRINDHPVLLQTVVCGQPLASLLASRPKRLPELMDYLAVWLERWNRSTVAIRPLDLGLLDRELLAPATLLGPLLERGREYRDWLTERCAAVAGMPVPLVATHNDLTMRNVFLTEQGRLGVIDWEAAREEGLPLVDFLYAVTDAAAAVRGYVDRPKAFEACFAPRGAHAKAVTQFLGRLRCAVEIPDEVAELCFHACWLHHAANEHRLGRSRGLGPFIEMVQQLHRRHFNAWTGY